MLDSNIEKPKKSGAQRRLEDIESKLRELIRDKKKLWKEFEEKNRELEILKIDYKKKLEEAERLQNQMILIWDYWQREVKILRLDEEIKAKVLPSEREGLMKEQLELVKYNKTLEMGFKDRAIDAKIVEEIKKRLGIWEDRKLKEKSE